MDEAIIECPLGSQCKSIKDNKQYRCAWYVKLVGKDPQSQKEYDDWGCAMSWIPVMLTENAQMTRGVQEATETFRNESVKGQAIFNNLLATATEQKKLNA